MSSPVRSWRNRGQLLFFSGLLFAGWSSLAEADTVDGKAVFKKNCAPCHGVDGRARTPAARKLKVKDLTESKTTDAEIEKQIVEGKKDDHGVQKMPEFGDKLSKDEIGALIGFVKSLRKTN